MTIKKHVFLRLKCNHDLRLCLKGNGHQHLIRILIVKRLGNAETADGDAEEEGGGGRCPCQT